jgi:SAM-dependent methyltransferase
MTEAGGDPWAQVWARRSVDLSRRSQIAQLLAADGYDTGFGDVQESDWVQGVRGWANQLGISSGSSVYEVGCGAGAFLYELDRQGCRVGGLDQSPALVNIARTVMPDGHFEVASAAELAPVPAADAVVSFSVFFYFPSLGYARHVIDRMVAKATLAVAILDLPDAARREEALAERVAAAGGPEAYAARYDGLDHLYYSRDWVKQALGSAGVSDVQTADQSLPGYRNGRFRFNAWGFLRPSTTA